LSIECAANRLLPESISADRTARFRLFYKYIDVMIAVQEAADMRDDHIRRMLMPVDRQDQKRRRMMKDDFRS
jgi:hypothetical protein